MRKNGGREASRKRGEKKTLEFDANELEVFHTLQGTSVNPQASMLLGHKIMLSVGTCTLRAYDVR